MTPLYFRSRSGALAVSVDGGDTLIVRTGRSLPVDDRVWEELDDAPGADLSDEQRAALEAQAGADARALAEEEAADARREAEAAARAEAEAELDEREARARAWLASPAAFRFRRRIDFARRDSRAAIERGDFSGAARALDRASRAQAEAARAAWKATA